MKIKVDKLEDILEIAIRMEREGIELYRTLHEKVEDPKERDIFAFLAAQEEKHLGTFRTLLEKVADYEPRYEYPGEYEAYLSGIAASIISSGKKTEEFLRSNNRPGAISAGLELEMQSILFYSELAEFFKGKDLEVLEEIIKEEKNHYARLASLNKLNF